jgi:hypothetical protein
MAKRREPPVTPNQPGSGWVNFSPIHINEFQQCPERFYLRHIRRIRVPWQFSRALAIGQATHAAMAFVWNQRLSGFEIPDDLQKLAAMYLKTAQYERGNEDAWGEDVSIVAGHVHRCLSTLDPNAEIVSVEREWSYALRDRDRQPSSTRIQSRVDVILRHDDGTVQHVDYKTGARRRDLTQEVMSRVVVRTMLAAKGWAEAPVVTSTLFTSDGALVSEQPDRETYRSVWNGVIETVGAIQTATTWRPRPGPHCRWCDFAKVHCSLGDEKPSE